LLTLVRQEIKIMLLRTVRYPMESLGSVIILYLLFLSIFAGSQYITFGGVSLLGTEPAHKLLGFLFYFATISGLSGIPGVLEDEAKTGTIANIFTSRFAPWIVLCIKSVVNLVFGLAYVALIWVISSVTIRVTAPVGGRSLCAVLLSYVGMIGLGLGFGGLALVFKRVGTLLNVVNLGLFVLAIYPGMPSMFARLTPFTHGLSLLRSAVSGSPAIVSDFFSLIGISLVYLVAGVFSFNKLVVVAKTRGSIGVY